MISTFNWLINPTENIWEIQHLEDRCELIRNGLFQHSESRRTDGFTESLMFITSWFGFLNN